MPEASFVYGAWLDAGGKFDDVRQPINDWLNHENNRLLPSAEFIYRAWLDSTRDTASVERALAEWLAVNGSADDIDHICRAWLEAGGRFNAVREYILEWLMNHSLERDAVYVLKYVVKQRVLPDDVTVKILDWCSKFVDDPDVVWRLNSLTAHISGDLFVEALRTSALILDSLFGKPHLSGLTRSQVTTILGNLSALDLLRSTPPSHELNTLLCRWINHPQSFEPTSLHGPHHQTRQFLARLVTAVQSESAPLDVSRLLAWVTCWNEGVRIDSSELIEQLRGVM